MKLSHGISRFVPIEAEFSSFFTPGKICPRPLLLPGRIGLTDRSRAGGPGHDRPTRGRHRGHARYRRQFADFYSNLLALWPAIAAIPLPLSFLLQRPAGYKH